MKIRQVRTLILQLALLSGITLLALLLVPKLSIDAPNADIPQFYQVNLMVFIARIGCGLLFLGLTIFFVVLTRTRGDDTLT